MFIGGSPASTGGGIKTTTIAVILQLFGRSFVVVKMLSFLSELYRRLSFFVQ